MGYLATFLVGATVGSFLQLWWQGYIEDTRDERSIARHDRARQSTPTNFRRWE